MLLRRVVAAPMWFVATLMMYELVIYVTGGPHPLGPILGVTAAFLVSADPLHRIWPAQDKSQSPLSALRGRDALPSHTQSV
ncbi:MAG: hypothetical protein E6I45_00975 [Chloroflexi bacterium]|nr:MAG: hypothetical protein E6I45_00975 [Chloroflexota bacterium]